MTIDKAKLKALAEAATSGERTAEKCAAGIPHVITEDWDIAEVHVTTGANPMADAEFMAAASPATVLALLAEIERLERSLHEEEGRSNMSGRAHRVVSEKRDSVEQERDQLKAENEALRKALGEISGQVDGNIRCTVRDVVNGLPDVQDIYGYCDAIDEIIDAAMAKEASHDHE
ncbi:ead/Ea22-like family protein [Pseudomonas monteilii]|uniref:ead/Ea22-like family protein n=1 Tax=Pseudomonas monteilii TaxID=76759 RepID=UPI003CFBC3BF